MLQPWLCDPRSSKCRPCPLPTRTHAPVATRVTLNPGERMSALELTRQFRLMADCVNSRAAALSVAQAGRSRAGGLHATGRPCARLADVAVGPLRDFLQSSQRFRAHRTGSAWLAQPAGRASARWRSSLTAQAEPGRPDLLGEFSTIHKLWCPEPESNRHDLAVGRF